MNTMLGALVVGLALLAVVVWFDARCLADLARTRDEDSRYLTRAAWALLIVAFFPLGPMIYLRYEKGPGGYASNWPVRT
jgi:hypothetical protein